MSPTGGAADVSLRTEAQRRRQANVERLIRLAEPGLNLVLAVGDRISRVIERDDPDYYPPRSGALPPPTAERPAGSDDE